MRRDAGLREYKAFIDGLVRVGRSIEADRVRNGIWHREPPSDQLKFNAVLSELTERQREVLAEIVQSAADSAIHDTLVLLTDRGFNLSCNGVALPQEPFDTEMYYDFVCRRQGDAWPDEAKNTKGPS